MYNSTVTSHGDTIFKEFSNFSNVELSVTQMEYVQTANSLNETANSLNELISLRDGFCKNQVLTSPVNDNFSQEDIFDYWNDNLSGHTHVK